MTESHQQSNHSCFIDPSGSNLHEVRALTHRMIDRVLCWRSTCASRPASPSGSPRSVNPAIPAEGRPEQEILNDLDALVFSSLATSHPDYVAHMGAVSSTMSPIGDFITSCVNNNLIALELSPALSMLEYEFLREFARFYGLGDRSGGVITTGGSLSNLHAIVAARNARLRTMELGHARRERPPVFLVSEAAHASMAKGAMITGLGAEGAVLVGTDAEGRMCVDLLQAKYDEVRSSGLDPFAVMATAGTTVTGSIDPLDDIHRFARERGLWFHVDAAWGGALHFSSKLRPRLSGIEHADSVTFCPQKLLMVGLSSSMILFRDMPAMAEHFRIKFPYVTEEEGFTNLCEIGIQGSRPAEVLKLWLTLQQVGQRRHAELIEHWVTLAESVAAQVRQRPYLSLLCNPATGIVCFRGTPSWVDNSGWDAWNSDLRNVVLKTSGIDLSYIPYKGPRWLRAVFANPFVQNSFVDRLFTAIDSFAAESPDAMLTHKELPRHD